MPCSYKNILGKPNEGFHKSRFFGYARNDVLGTVIVGILLGAFFSVSFLFLKNNISYKKFFPFLIINIILFTLFLCLLGQWLHYIFCVDTAFIKQYKDIILLPIY